MMNYDTPVQGKLFMFNLVSGETVFGYVHSTDAENGFVFIQDPYLFHRLRMTDGTTSFMIEPYIAVSPTRVMPFPLRSVITMLCEFDEQLIDMYHTQVQTNLDYREELNAKYAEHKKSLTEAVTGPDLGSDKETEETQPSDDKNPEDNVVSLFSNMGNDDDTKVH